MKQIWIFLCLYSFIKAAYDETFNKYGSNIYAEDKTFSLMDLSDWKNRVKWSSLVHSVDHPPFSLAATNDSVPLATRLARRKRCTCGCSGCDLFPQRTCCGPDCCSSEPVPLACCPPPPPPKPCCQPNFGPCCPATPNCCKKKCCKGQRPDIYEDEDFGAPPPAPPASDRTCCPPLSPAQPPNPPTPPEPPPEPPIECCAPPPKKKTPCGDNNACGRPCCYYRDAECCRTKPCCPPELPCCPPLPTLPNLCCNMAPPCLRSCPTCPCRKRIHLGTRTKRQGFGGGLHCQQCLAPGAITSASAGLGPKQQAAKTFVANTTPKPNPLLAHTESRDIVEEAPHAGKLFENSRHIRVKRAGCQMCIDGRPLKREKRHACVQCSYLHPLYGSTPNVPGYGVDGRIIQTPVPIPLLEHLREKRNGCIPPPTCLTMRRRSKRNFNSQYCEPCPGGYRGRSKREEERQQCMDRRKKRAAEGEQYCEEEEDNNDSSREEIFGSITRMKRQAYSPNGALDIVKVLSKMTTNRAAGPGGCMEFPACVLAQKRRRKRHAARRIKYQKAMKRYKRELKRELKKHEKLIERHKRQFFAPDAAGANCAPCPAWVTLALTTRRKRDAPEANQADFDDIKYALKDIRRRQKNLLYEEDACEQTGDCMNDSEYGEWMRKYHLGRRKRRQSSFNEPQREKKCVQCHGKQSKGRSKRAFGGPTINASAGNCYAFPACRTRVKRHGLECNVCTSNANPLKKVKKNRTKRNIGSVQCYPCGTGK